MYDEHKEHTFIGRGGGNFFSEKFAKHRVLFPNVLIFVAAYVQVLQNVQNPSNSTPLHEPYHLKAAIAKSTLFSEPGKYNSYFKKNKKIEKFYWSRSKLATRTKF